VQRFRTTAAEWAWLSSMARCGADEAVVESCGVGAVMMIHGLGTAVSGL
jgi:hypothetical protein